MVSNVDVIIISSILCLFLAGLCEAVMDTLAHHYETSIFSFWNKKYWYLPVSSMNKKKYSERKDVKGRIMDVVYQSVIVGFLDGWHLAKMIRTFMLFMVIGTVEYMYSGSIWITVICRIWFGIIFTLFYHIFKIK